MSTFVDLLPQTLDDVCEPETIEVEREEFRRTGLAGWAADGFAEEQIRSLVRQVFLPGWPKPAHQVVFSSVDPETDISAICMQVGLALSAQVAGTTCLVEANLNGPRLEQVLENNGLDLVPNQERSALRDSSRRLSNELWLMSRSVFFGEHESGWSGAWLRDRLAELRARCQRQTNSFVTPMGDGMFYRYQQSLIDEATTTVGALLQRSKAQQSTRPNRID